MNNLYIMNLAIADFLIGMAKGSNWNQPSLSDLSQASETEVQTVADFWIGFGLQFGASFDEFLYSLFGLWQMDFWEIYMWWNELKRFLKSVFILKLGFMNSVRQNLNRPKNENGRSFNWRSRQKQRF